MTARIVIVVNPDALTIPAVVALREHAREIDPEAVVVGMTADDLALVARYVARIAEPGGPT